jgi:RNA recognition motif. (a.k.a. RRM, RBD, or RNP domain)
MGDLPARSAEKYSSGKKRKKAKADEGDIDSLGIDINAPEPASRKVLRKAKRAKAAAVQHEDKLGPTDPKIPKKTFEEKAASNRSSHGIWIGNLPFFVTKKDLEVFLTGDTENTMSLDQITRIHLPKGAPKPGSHFQNKGFAYIDFDTAEAVQQALQSSEKLLGGRRVLIKSSHDFQGRPQPTSKISNARSTSTKRIFVGNLGFDVTKEDLERHFKICGPIHSIQVATFEDSGKCKGYAWIEFEKLDSAESAMRGWLEISETSANTGTDNAIEVNNSKKTKKRTWVNKMGDRKMRMEFAEDKATRYKKRFGKESRSEGLKRFDVGDVDHLIDDGQNERAKEADKVAETKLSPKRPRRVDYSQPIRSGYSVSSVQKMIGAITDGQGTKTTFE